MKEQCFLFPNLHLENRMIYSNIALTLVGAVLGQ